MPRAPVPATSIPHARLRQSLGLPQIYRAFGVCFALRLSLAAQAEPAVSDHLSDYLPCETLPVTSVSEALSCTSFAIRHRPDGLAWRLFRGRQLLLEAADLQRVLHCLRGMLVGHVGERAPDRVFVHAGVVGWQGRAIVLPGDSFAGKTTLVAALVRAGAFYYSDEIAALDVDGRVHPYARALQMRRPGSPEQRAMPVSELNGTAGREPLPVGLVAFARFDATVPSQQDRWKLLTPGRALLQGMRHTFPVRVAPQRVMQAWARVLEQAPAWKGIRGDAAATAAQMLRTLAAGEPLA